MNQLLLIMLALLAPILPATEDDAEKTTTSLSSELSGFVDVQGRITDPDDDSGFEFHDASLYLSSTIGPVSLFVDLPMTTNEDDDVDFDSDRVQAYLSGEHNSGWLWQLGRFDSILGYEDNDSVGNPFSTTSLFAGNIFPSTLTGVLAGRKLSDALTLSATITNPAGEDSLNGEDPEFGAILEWETEAFRGYVGGLSHSRDKGTRTILDIVLGKSFGELDADLEITLTDPPAGDSGWGALFYAIYKNEQRWSPVLRLETVRDQEGLSEAEAAGIGLMFRPYRNVLFKLDYSYGQSRVIPTVSRENGSLLALAALYRF